MLGNTKYHFIQLLSLLILIVVGPIVLLTWERRHSVNVVLLLPCVIGWKLAMTTVAVMAADTAAPVSAGWSWTLADNWNFTGWRCKFFTCHRGHWLTNRLCLTLLLCKCYKWILNNVACEQVPSEPERSEGACRHSIDAAVLWYQLLVSWYDWLNRWLLTSLRSIFDRSL